MCFSQAVLTQEHIIPQGLGGRLKAPLLCKACNSTLGSTIDAEIERCIGPIATLLDVTKEKSKNRPVSIIDLDTGAELSHDGKGIGRKGPIVSKELTEDGKKLKSAEVRGASKREVEKIVRGLAQKYGFPEKQEITEIHHTPPSNTKLTIQFDSRAIRRAIAKICYGLLCVKMAADFVLCSYFDTLRAYIRNDTGPDLAEINFRDTRFMTDYARPLHRVHITFSRQTHQVLGIVMLFGIFRYVAVLSRTFESYCDWPDLDYVFDPLSGKELSLSLIPPGASGALSEKAIPWEVDPSRGWKMLEGYVKDFQFKKIRVPAAEDD